MNGIRIGASFRKMGILPRKERGPFCEEFIRRLSFMLVLMPVTIFLNQAGCLQTFEATTLDSLLLWKTPQKVERIIIVFIDDKDYESKELFQGQSPLNSLRIYEIITAIASGSPAVIGVEIDTSSEGFNKKNMERMLKEQKLLKPGESFSWPNAIWARDARTECRKGEDCVLKLMDVLGGDVSDLPPKSAIIETDPKSGVVLFPQDSDGIIRRYRRIFEATKSDQRKFEGEEDSLPWAIVKEYCNKTKLYTKGCETIAEMQREAENIDEGLVLNFSGDRYNFAQRFSASAILTGSKKPYWKENSPLKDKIVLLGGFYHAARDEYITPLGPMAGVLLIAQAIESDLGGGGIRPVNHRVGFVLEFLAGIALVWLNWRQFRRAGIWVNGIAMVSFAFVCSVLTFGALAYWFNFIPFLVGVWLDIEYGHIWDKFFGRLISPIKALIKSIKALIGSLIRSIKALIESIKASIG